MFLPARATAMTRRTARASSDPMSDACSTGFFFGISLSQSGGEPSINLTMAAVESPNRNLSPVLPSRATEACFLAMITGIRESETGGVRGVFSHSSFRAFTEPRGTTRISSSGQDNGRTL